MRRSEDGPVAIHTKCGWVLFPYFTCLTMPSMEESLDEVLHSSWKLESRLWWTQCRKSSHTHCEMPL